MGGRRKKGVGNGRVKNRHALWECGITPYVAQCPLLPIKHLEFESDTTGWLWRHKGEPVPCVMNLEMSHMTHSGAILCNIHMTCRCPPGCREDEWAPRSWIVQSHSIVMLLPERHTGSRSRKQGMQEQAGVMEAATNHLVRMLNRRLHGQGPSRGPGSWLYAWGLWSRSC